MAKKKNAPILRAAVGGDQPAPAVTKSYSVRDDWKDINKVNYVAFKSVDGEVQDLTVNGEPAGGGGGGDFSMAQVVISNNTENEIQIGGVPVIDIETDELYTEEYITTGTTSLTIVLYKGGPTHFSFATTAKVNATGSIEIQKIGLQMKDIYITGDGTITIS